MKVYTVKIVNNLSESYHLTIDGAKAAIERIPGTWVQNIDVSRGYTGQYVTEEGFFPSQIYVLGWVDAQ